MKRLKFNEEQIIGILREQEVGGPTAEVCRRHGISSAAFYAWKAKLSSFLRRTPVLCTSEAVSKPSGVRKQVLYHAVSLRM